MRIVGVMTQEFPMADYVPPSVWPAATTHKNETRRRVLFSGAFRYDS